MQTERNKWSNSREYLQQLIRISFLSISAPLLLFGWLYLEHSADNLDPLVDSKWILPAFFIVILLMVASVYFGQVSISKRLMKIKPEQALLYKLSEYKKVITTRFLSYAVAALLIVGGFLITATEMMAIPFAIMIVLYSIYNPSLRAIVRELRLKGDEKEMILKNLPL